MGFPPLSSHCQNDLFKSKLDHITPWHNALNVLPLLTVKVLTTASKALCDQGPWDSSKFNSYSLSLSPLLSPHWLFPAGPYPCHPCSRLVFALAVRSIRNFFPQISTWLIQLLCWPSQRGQSWSHYLNGPIFGTPESPLIFSFISYSVALRHFYKILCKLIMWYVHCIFIICLSG